MLIALSVGSAYAADPVFVTGDFIQGGLAYGHVLPGSKVMIGTRHVRISNNGDFVFGFGRDHGKSITLDLTLADGTLLKKSYNIKSREYDIQRIEGLPPSKVTPSAKFLKRIRKENSAIAKIRAINAEETWFKSGWIWPAKGRISGVYGSQRILNGKSKRPHFGIDVAGPVGTAVIAPADGVVKMVEADLYYTGGTIMMDHGHGLVSVFLHLSKTHVRVGDVIRQGYLIGEIGATGRATGPHLDWRLNWFKQRLDPQLLVGPMTK